MLSLALGDDVVAQDVVKKSPKNDLDFVIAFHAH